MASNSKQILVVDDSPLMLELAKDVLEPLGFAVVVAQTMDELEAQSESLKPDMVLMDVQMPELFGDDVAMVLRQIRGIEAPIYLWSNLAHEDLAERAGRATLDGFICKRDGIQALVEVVTNVLGNPGEEPSK